MTGCTDGALGVRRIETYGPEAMEPVPRDRFGHVHPGYLLSQHERICYEFPYRYGRLIGAWHRELMALRMPSARMLAMSEGRPDIGFGIEGVFTHRDFMLPLEFPTASFDRALFLSAKWHANIGRTMHGLGPLRRVVFFAGWCVRLRMSDDGSRLASPTLNAEIRASLRAGLFPGPGLTNETIACLERGSIRRVPEFCGT